MFSLHQVGNSDGDGATGRAGKISCGSFLEIQFFKLNSYRRISAVTSATEICQSKAIRMTRCCYAGHTPGCRVCASMHHD